MALEGWVRSMAMTRRWVRFVVPVMVEVDCDEDEVTRVVVLAEEVRPDRDDLGHFCVYDEGFVRRYSDEQPQIHAYSVAQPVWEHDEVRVGPAGNWPRWEEGFELSEADDRYSEINPYATPQR